MFTTGNLLVFAASFVLILIFRRFDRRRMELSKIKKYSERIIAEYEELAKVKLRDFKDATIELDLLTKKAKLTLQTADGSLENISKLVSEIDARQSELAGITSDVKNTEVSAREVRRLQAAISRDESAIRKLLSTVDSSRNSLNEIEKRLPALEKSFHARIEDKASSWTREVEARELPRLEKTFESARIRLSEYFKTVSADAESRIISRLTAFETRLDQAEADLDGCLTQHINSIALHAASATEELERTRNDQLVKFTQQLEKNAAAAAESLQETSATIAKQRAAVETLLHKARTDLSLELDAVQESISGLGDKTNTIDTRIQQFVEESKLFDRADRLMERLHTELKALTTQVEKCSAEKKSVSELEKRIATVRDERSAVEGLVARLSERKIELQAIENHAAAITGEIDRIEASLKKQQPLFEKTQTMIEKMQDELAKAEVGIKKTGDIRGKLETLETKGDEVRRMLDGINGDKKSLVTLENRIATMGDSVIRLEQSLTASKNDIDSKTAEIERTIEDFTEKTAIFEKAENLTARLESEVNTLDHRIQEVRDERDHLSLLKNDLADMRKDEDSLRAMMATVEKSRTELANVELRVQSAGAVVEQFESMLEKKKQEIEKNFEKDSGKIRSEIQRLEKTLASVREKSLQETQNGIGSLKSDIKEMDKRIKDFTKETALFERADKLSNKLSEDIAELNTRISQLRVDKKDLLDLGKQIESIRKEETEIARIANAVSTDHKHFSDLEKRMNELARTSSDVEARIQELSRASAIIQPVENQLADVAERQIAMKKSLEELTVKDAKLAQSHTRFKKAETFAEKLDTQLEVLKANFEHVQKEKTTLEKHVDEMQEKSRKLVENEVRISKLLTHFEQMNGMLSDVERRTAQLTIAQDRLGKMENSIRDLSGQAEVRIDDLSELSRKIDSFFGISGPAKAIPNTGKNKQQTQKSIKTEPPVDERKVNEMIFKMYDQGMDAAQIAHIIRRPISDVELRLHVRKE